MNYEIEQSLSRKADTWQFHNLEQEHSRLKSEHYSLQRTVNQLESKQQSHYTAIEKLINILMEVSALTVEQQGDLNTIRAYL